MTQTLASYARAATDCAVLDDIRKPDCSIAIWQRDLAADLANLDVPDAAEVRFVAKLADVKQRITEAMKAAGYKEQDDWAPLQADILALAHEYARILRIDEVEVRLEVVTTDACRKFHADYVSARLITTYAGTGTQWLEAEDAQAVASGEEPHTIRTMNAGDVGLFKGKLATDTPAVHRSPPIGGTGERRLLLVLNPPSQAS